MPGQTLDTLPADGSLPATLPAHPDTELAYAWAKANGGKIAVYVLDAGNPKIAGYWEGNAPARNPYDGIFHHTTIPPQWREVDSKSAFDIFNVRDNRTFTIDEHTGEKVWTEHPGLNGMENQPDWDWKPDQLPAKPNRLK